MPLYWYKIWKKRTNFSCEKKSPLQIRLPSHKKRKIFNISEKSIKEPPVKNLKDFEQNPEFVTEILNSRHMSSWKNNPLNKEFEEQKSSTNQVFKSFKSSTKKENLLKTSYNEKRYLTRNNIPRSPITSNKGSISPLSNIATAKKWINGDNSQKSIINLKPQITPPKPKISYPVYSPSPNHPTYLSPSPYHTKQIRIERETVMISNSKQINHIPQISPHYNQINYQNSHCKSPCLLSASQSQKQITPIKQFYRRSLSTKNILQDNSNSNKIVISGVKNNESFSRSSKQEIERNNLEVFKGNNLEQDSVKIYNRVNYSNFSRLRNDDNDGVRKVIFQEKKRRNWV